MGTLTELLKVALRAATRAPLVHRGMALAPPANAEPCGQPTNPVRAIFEGHEGNGVAKLSHYFDVYHRHLAKFVGTSATLLEIGVGSGGSLEMWAEYLGPSAHIWGVDINPKCAAYRRGQIEVFIGAQADRRFLASIHPDQGIDAVIDDGSHNAEDQVVSFEELFPRLSRGAVYICEDTAGTQNPFLDYVHGLAKNLNSITPLKGASAIEPNPLQLSVQSITLYPYMVVIEKGEHRLPRIKLQKRGSLWLAP